VFIEIERHLGGAVDDIVAVNRAGERFILQLLPHRLHLHLAVLRPGFIQAQAVRKPASSSRVNSGSTSRLFARHAAVVCLGENGAANLFADAALGEEGLAFHWVIGRLRTSQSKY